MLIQVKYQNREKIKETQPNRLVCNTRFFVVSFAISNQYRIPCYTWTTEIFTATFFSSEKRLSIGNEIIIKWVGKKCLHEMNSIWRQLQNVKHLGSSMWKRSIQFYNEIFRPFLFSLSLMKPVQKSDTFCITTCSCIKRNTKFSSMKIFISKQKQRIKKILQPEEKKRGRTVCSFEFTTNKLSAIRSDWNMKRMNAASFQLWTQFTAEKYEWKRDRMSG